MAAIRRAERVIWQLYDLNSWELLQLLNMFDLMASKGLTRTNCEHVIRHAYSYRKHRGRDMAAFYSLEGKGCTMRHKQGRGFNFSLTSKGMGVIEVYERTLERIISDRGDLSYINKVRESIVE